MLLQNRLGVCGPPEDRKRSMLIMYKYEGID
jgi:hypothetical protein